jgi:hypothetical protein
MLSVVNKPIAISVTMLSVAGLSVIMLNVICAACHKKPIAMSVIRLSVVMLNVIMLNVVAPVQHLSNNPKTEGSNPA